MDPALAALYERVKARLPRDEFDRRVEQARAEFDGLLDDEALGLLVLDELGLNEGAYATLGDLKGRSEATVRVRVERIDPARTFERPGRDPGRVVNVVVSDATGDSRVVFWDKDTERAQDLAAGQHVTLVNARVKETGFGIELHVGPWTLLEVEGALDPAKAKLLADVAPEKAEKQVRQAKLPMEDLPTRLEGALVWIGDTRPVRQESATRFACDCDIETATGIRRVVAWDLAVKAIRSTPVGTRVRVDPLAPKVKGASTEWHTLPDTKVDRA